MFEFIKKHFPIKADSLDEFMKIVEKEGGVSVSAKPRIRGKNETFTVSVGRVGEKEYCVRFESETPRGRPIIFDEVYGSRFGSEYGFGDSQDRGVYALKGLLTADKRLEEVRERLPSIETALVGPKGEIDETTRQRMYEDAKKQDISPFQTS